MTDTSEGEAQNPQAVNAGVIAEFRQHGGKPGGRLASSNLALLHTTGARSGHERVNPLVYLRDNGRIYLVAAAPSLPHHPDWYYNLLAHPDVTVEIGSSTLLGRARELTGEARDRIRAMFVAEMPMILDWERATGRVFPMIELTPES